MGPCRAARVPLGLASTRLELPWGARAPFRGAKHRQQLHPKHSWKSPAGPPAGSVSRPICTRAPRPFFYSRNGTSNKVTLTRKASRPSLPRGAGLGTWDVPAELPHSGRELRGSAWCAQSPLGSWGQPQGRTGWDRTGQDRTDSHQHPYKQGQVPLPSPPRCPPPPPLPQISAATRPPRENRTRGCTDKRLILKLIKTNLTKSPKRGRLPEKRAPHGQRGGSLARLAPARSGFALSAQRPRARGGRPAGLRVPPSCSSLGLASQGETLLETNLSNTQL